MNTNNETSRSSDELGNSLARPVAVLWRKQSQIRNTQNIFCRSPERTACRSCSRLYAMAELGTAVKRLNPSSTWRTVKGVTSLACGRVAYETSNGLSISLNAVSALSGGTRETSATIPNIANNKSPREKFTSITKYR